MKLDGKTDMEVEIVIQESEIPTICKNEHS